MLSSRDRFRRNLAPIPDSEEARYHKVKRSMAAIKRVLGERKKIEELKKQLQNTAVSSNGNDTTQ